MKVSELITKIRETIGVPADDRFFSSEELLNFAHDGALTAILYLPEEMLGFYLTSVVRNVAPGAGLDNDIVQVDLPSGVFRLKSVEVQRTDKTWRTAFLKDLNDVLAMRNRHQFYPSPSYLEFYYALIGGNRIGIFPGGFSGVRIYYLRMPEKRMNILLEADYPEQMIPLIVEYAASRALQKDPGKSGIAQTHLNIFSSFLSNARAVLRSEVPPKIGNTGD